MIIYWFGYHEETPALPDNNIGITVLADFPAKEDLVFMQLAHEEYSAETPTTKEDSSSGSQPIVAECPTKELKKLSWNWKCREIVNVYFLTIERNVLVKTMYIESLNFKWDVAKC